MFCKKISLFIVTILFCNTGIAENTKAHEEFNYGINVEETLLSVIDRTVTFFGKAHLLSIIKNPESQNKILVERQNAIKEVHNNEQLFTELDKLFKQAKEAQDTFAYLYKEKTSSTYTKLEELRAVAIVVRALYLCSNLLKGNVIFSAGIEYKSDLHSLFLKPVSKESEELYNLVQVLLDKDPAFFDINQLSCELRKVKDQFLPALKAFGEVDALLSAVKFLKELEKPIKIKSF